MMMIKKMRIIMFREAVASALKRGISYREPVQNKTQYADVMYKLTKTEEEEEEEVNLLLR
jgi:hypothetical protein